MVELEVVLEGVLGLVVHQQLEAQNQGSRSTPDC